MRCMQRSCSDSREKRRVVIMWGRRKGPDTVQEVKAVLEGGGARAISALDDLLRHAEWEGLTEGERGMLLAPLQGKQPPLLSDGAPPSERDAGLQLQDWVAQLVGGRFQPEVASVVRVWLESGAPDGHLYVGGRPAPGRTSLAASLARAAMAARPIPPDYCYVPDIRALARHSVLTVPKGDGSDFRRDLSN